MSFWIILILIVGGLLLLGQSMSVGASRKASHLLKSIENRYEHFIEQYINSIIVNDEKIELDNPDLHKKLDILLKPEMEALIGFINSTDLSDVRIKYQPKFFNNVARISEAMLDKRNKFKNHPISEEDEERLRQALQDAIQADLTQRSITLKGLLS